MVDVFHLFHVLYVLPTYSMFSHPGWQDGTICRALLTISASRWILQSSQTRVSKQLKKHSQTYDPPMSLNNNEVVAGKFFLLKGGLPKSLIREQVVVPTPSKFQPGASCKHIPAKRPTKHSSKWRRRCRRPPESVVGHLGAPALSRPPHSNTDNLWIGGRHDGY